jgi:RIO-like serine/threonine protein kinase
VIALSGRNVSPAKLEKEIADLNKLQDVGLPVVRHYGLVFVGSERGILMDFIADARSSTITTGTRNMNQNTIDDLMMIKRILRERNIHIKDFQFLIATDGHVYIIDPQGVGNGVQQSNISLIDTMLALAREAVPS